MSSNFPSAKLFICIVGRNRGEKLVSISKKVGARGGTIALGRTTGSNRLLQAFCLADMQQDVVFTLMGAEAPAVIAAVKAAAAAAPRKLGGVAVLLDVSGMLLRRGSQLEVQLHTGREKMESGHKLISIIVNDGHAEDVMATARKAGASGGTILTARGTGTEEDVKFFCISLVPEKEMLLIVAPSDKVAPILDAVRNIKDLCEPGGGIAYTLDVEEFTVLGQ